MDILDKKSKNELEKHKNNFYENKLVSRNNKELTFTNNEFTLDNVITNENIFKISIRKFSGFYANYYYSGKNPLVNTSLEILNNKNLEISKSYLFNYYSNFQPKTYGEVYNLRKENKLHHLESTDFFHPWIHKLPTNTFNRGLFGPKDITSVEHRIIRLKNIIYNINKYGYIPSNDDIIEGYILLKKDDYRFIILAGHHRVAVLTAMNMLDKSKYNKILVKFDQKRTTVKVIKDKDVKNWPGVKSGYINEFDALEIFNSYF